MAYEKWDYSEEPEVAFENVKSGAWTLERFKEWVRQVRHEEYMDATADENM